MKIPTLFENLQISLRLRPMIERKQIVLFSHVLYAWCNTIGSNPEEGMGREDWFDSSCKPRG